MKSFLRFHRGDILRSSRITDTPNLVALGIVLFFLPFFIFKLPDLSTILLPLKWRLHNSLVINQVFIACYSLIGILFALPLYKEDKQTFALTVVGLSYLALCSYNIKAVLHSTNIPTFDIGAHFSTMLYIVNNHSLQPLELGQESHQPPLYYIIAAVTMMLGQWAQINFYTPVYHLSFLLFCIFLVFAVRLAALLLNNLVLRYITIFGIFLWPAHLLHCCRPSNDLLIYAILMMAIYYSVRWYLTESRRDFIYTALLVSLCCLVKPTAAILATFCAITLLFKSVQLGSMRSLLAISPPLRTLAILGVIFAMCASFNPIRVSYYNSTHGGDAAILTGDHHSPDKGLEPRMRFFNDIYTFRYHLYVYEHINSNMFMGFWANKLRTALYTKLAPRMRYEAYWLGPMINLTFLLTVLICGFMYFYQVILKQRSLPAATLLLAFEILCVFFQQLMGFIYPYPGFTISRHSYTAIPVYVILYTVLAQSLIPGNRNLYYCCMGLFVFLVALLGALILLQVV